MHPNPSAQVQIVAEHAGGVPQIVVSGMFLLVYLTMARALAALVP